MTRRLIYGEITADEVVAADTANVLQDSGLANSGRLSHGSCWGNEIGWTQANAAQNTWYAISDADMSDGQLAHVTHDGSGKLTVDLPGKYLISYAVSAECSASNKHMQTGIGITQQLMGLLDSLEAGIRKLHWKGATTEWGDYMTAHNYTPAALEHKKQID